MHYFEDFRVGDRFRSQDHIVVEADMVAFARQFDPQSFHIDPQAAKQSIFGHLIASGWYTAALAMRLRTESGIEVAGGLIGLGLDEVRWPRPVFAGDTLHLEGEVIEVRESRSKPDRGIVRVRELAINQTGQTVMSMVTALYVPRRTVTAAGASRG